MGLPDIVFTKGAGGLGRVLPNEDHITGLIFGKTFTSPDTAPDVPFTSSKILDLADAETKGLTEALYPVEHAQIKEFFTLNPGATLYVGFETAEDGAFTYAIITTLQTLAVGKIRQFGVYVDSEFAVADITTIQVLLTALEVDHKPCSLIFSADMSAEDISAMDDLRTESAAKISCLLASDASGVPALGNLMGIISLAAVHENVGWIEKFRADVTGNYAAIYFATGEAISEVSTATLEDLNDKGWIFMKNHVGIAGSYYNDSHTTIPLTSDYAYIENNRTIDKAIRGVRTSLLPKLLSPIEVDPTSGQLAQETIKTFENLGGKNLEQMLKDGELSGYKVTVPADQDVLSTSKLEVTVQLVIKGVARTISVTIGFATSI